MKLDIRRRVFTSNSKCLNCGSTNNLQIDHIYPEILDNFPNLRRLDLSNNPIYEGGPDGVNALRQYAVEHYPDLEIIADNILLGDPPGIDIKGD